MHSTSSILGQSKVRLFLTMNGRLHRDALLRELVSDDEIEFVGESGSGTETIELLAVSSPSTLIIEENLKDIDGLTTAEMALQYNKGLTIILLVDQDISRQRLAIYLDSGIKSVISKSQPLPDLLQAIKYTRNGNIFLDPNRLKDSASVDRAENLEDEAYFEDFQSLSDREQEVSKLLADQTPLSEIALRLGVASKTVHTYKERILTKLGIQTHAELVVYIKRLKFAEAKKEKS